MGDPFEVESAELMDPERVALEFVKEHTEYAKLASHSHTIVWGSRGSGKSMHFKYLEPQAQALDMEPPRKGEVRRFLEDPSSFVGIYINCRGAILNRSELRRAATLEGADTGFVDMILSRYLACVVFRTLVRTIRDQVPWILQVACAQQEVPRFILALLSGKGDSVGEMLSAIEPQVEDWLLKLNELVDGLIRNLPESTLRQAFPEQALRLTTDLMDLLQFLQKAAGLNAPFFLMFDEANELCSVHQRCLNSLMALRSQRSVCIKVASQRHGFTAGPRLEATRPIDETHDYKTIDLDGLYTNNKQAYYKRLERIGDERLRRAGVESASIRSYLPIGANLLRRIGEARKLAEQRYDALPQETRPKDKANFVKKYAPAIIFQDLVPAKAAKIYCGFDNVVHLSSGIVRSFLDCCSMMYSKCVEKHPESEPSQIPIRIQSDVIRDYSDEFVQAQILGTMNALSQEAPERRLYAQLHNLLNGLGSLFRGRLLDRESREPRIISISLKDEPQEELRQVLALAERDAFLHAKWYRSKRGDRNLRCYVLNRRLCPHYNLDLTGFQGRIEVSSAELSLSLADPALFARTILTKPEDTPGDTRQLQLFDW